MNLGLNLEGRKAGTDNLEGRCRRIFVPEPRQNATLRASVSPPQTQILFALLIEPVVLFSRFPAFLIQFPVGRKFPA